MTTADTDIDRLSSNPIAAIVTRVYDLFVGIPASLPQLVLRIAVAVPFLKSGFLKWDGFLQLSETAVFLFAYEFKLHILGSAYSFPAPGLTAYVGMVHLGEGKQGDQVFVSAASGAVGQIACQLGRLHGARVAGSAGSDDKVAFLKDKVGLDAAFNYKTQGSIFGRMRDNAVCAVHKGIQDYLFEKLAQGDPQVRQTFERWTTIRPREHFIQPPGEAPATEPPAPEAGP